MARALVLLAVASLLLTAPDADRLPDVVAELHATEAVPTAECSKAVSEPVNADSLQEYFDGIRKEYGILDNTSDFLGEGAAVDASKCTKRDVCLLMRQLDMDFYKRARSGMLQDADYTIAPTQLWVAKGDCSGQAEAGGFKMLPLKDEGECKIAAEKQGAVFRKKIQESSLPSGCVIRDRSPTGKKLAYLNEAESTAKAGTEYVERSKRDKVKRSTVRPTNSMPRRPDLPAPRTFVKTTLLCVMDRSLEEAGAAYYSPYKLKPSMIGRETKSASCSFGMFAFLAKLRETMSPCAKILTYETHGQFQSAEHAMQVAETLEASGNSEGADTIRKYVESIRQKYVLMNLVANKWCPGVWTAAISANEGSCEAPRVMAWTEQGQAIAQAEAGKKRKSSKRPSGRLAAAQAKRGNQGMLDDIDKLLAGLNDEDSAAAQLASEKDVKTRGHADSRGKPIKIALTEAACSAFDDEDLATALFDKPQAPADTFRDGAALAKS